MSYSSELITLGNYLCGTFDNKVQGMGDPVWYVTLQVWHRPTKLFQGDSVTIFAEQANILNLDQPYRQRLMRLQDGSDGLTVQFYGFKDPGKFLGAGQTSDLLTGVTSEEIDFLPGCLLKVESRSLNGKPGFWAIAPEGSCCQFKYGDKIGQVSLGFAVSETEFHSYDKGINPETQKPIWGALMGPYQHQKRSKF
jgi:CpeT/CpcT family (DUF1001)